MKKLILLACAAAAAAAYAVDPSIKEGSVTMTQADSHLVTIAYELEGADAIVTLDITTNGVSIGAENIRGLVGAVNRRVSPGKQTITWQPNKSWRNHVITDHSARAVVTAWHPSVPPPYMVVGLSTPNSVRYFVSAGAIDGGVDNEQYKREFMILRKVPAQAAVWRMGVHDGLDGWAQKCEKAHLVTFTNDFYVGIYPVTQGQFSTVMGAGSVDGCNYNRSAHTDWWNHPVEKTVSYNNIRGATEGAKWPTVDAFDDGSFCEKMLSLTGVRFDLPTDAEWEFAARAGNPYSTAVADNGYTADETVLSDYAWWGENSADASGTLQTHEVGTRKANAWGIYDMQGNVWEICRDWYEEVCSSPADGSPIVSPKGPGSGTARVLRPSGYNGKIGMYRVHRFTFRNSVGPKDLDGSIGFRLVHEVSGE